MLLRCEKGADTAATKLRRYYFAVRSQVGFLDSRCFPRPYCNGGLRPAAHLGGAILFSRGTVYPVAALHLAHLGMLWLPVRADRGKILAL